MITFYKPNTANQGALLSVSHTARADKKVDGKVTEKGEKAVWLNFVKQTSWNATEKLGSFKDGKKLNVKLSPTEVAGIIFSIEENKTLAQAMGVPYVYHDGDSYGLTITFEPAFKKEKQGDKWVSTTEQRGFKMQVTKTNKANKEEKETIGVGLTYAEMSLLKHYLIDSIYHICGAWKAEDVAGSGKKAEKKAATATEPAAAAQTPAAAAPVVTAEPEDEWS